MMYDKKQEMGQGCETKILLDTKLVDKERKMK